MNATTDFAAPIFLAAFIAVSALLLGYILRLFRNYETNQSTKNQPSEADAKKHLKEASKSKNKKSSSGDVSNQNKWSNRGERVQKFSSPWLLTNLKGHTGQVLGADYSPNGKYLASCGEEDPDGDPDGMTSSSGTDSKEISPMATPIPRTKGLSRRQRKNRRREDSSPDSKKKKNTPMAGLGAPVTRYTSPLDLEIRKNLERQWQKLKVTPRKFADMLYSHLLTNEQLYASGYPVQSAQHNNAVIFLCIPPNGFGATPSNFDVNAREFVPNRKVHVSSTSSPELSPSPSPTPEGDSNNGNTSDSSEDLEVPSPANSEQDLLHLSDIDTKSSEGYEEDCQDQGVERKCARCNQGFFVTNREYLTTQRCIYHWGKIQRVKNSQTYEVFERFSCCHLPANSKVKGCCASKLHVWSGVVYGVNGPFQGFHKTRKNASIPPHGYHGVYALDCEMCYTVAGLEVTKVTLVAPDGTLAYDTFVKPKNEIVDYNTRFSGITKQDLERPGNTKTLRQVQNDLTQIINSDTILIGHGLENDLRALKIIHKNVVDTAWSFPHFNGFPYKRSLRNLVSTILKRDVQNSPDGHNSYEDACACMELMLYTVRKENRQDLDSDCKLH